MKTQDQILERIQNIQSDQSDFFGKRTEVLVYALDFEHAKEFLADGVTEAEWDGPADPRAEAAQYLPFAIEKIVGERGLSASRSVDAFGEWVWLAAGDEAYAEYAATTYGQYGVGQVRAAAATLGLTAEFDAELAAAL